MDSIEMTLVRCKQHWSINVWKIKGFSNKTDKLSLT